MTVGEVIQRLEQFDPDKEFYVCVSGDEVDFMGFKVESDSFEDNVNIYLNVGDSDLVSC